MKSKATAFPYLVWMAIFIVVPLALVAYYAVTTPEGTFTIDYISQVGEYTPVLVRSVWLAFIATVICLLIAYPLAFIISRHNGNGQRTMIMLIMLPMWMNFLLRTYSWMSLLERTGLINSLIGWLNGILPAAIQIPALDIMYTQGAVVLGNVYNFLPFMILPIYTVLIKIDNSLIEAAQDLGASRGRVFRKIIFPLSLSGVVSGISMTFMPAVTTFVISRLLGGGQNALIGDMIENQFKVVGDWGFGSAMSVILMILILITMNVIRRYESENTKGSVLM